MASQSLYRKWRSQTFEDFVGQEAIVDTLKNALNTGSVRQAYLFTGPRGTGKTSTARLLAKAINCANPHNGEPCNECQQCREITAGNSFNVIEIDAASNRGIDSIRELREKVRMPPSTGKYKVYILDEAHMLTAEAFNALLKTLEEPPPHAIFVLATTDVHKMLPTVISRCQQFDFKRFTMRQIVGHLNFVAAQEQVKLDSGAAELIARAASGGMRDALSLLDQAIAYSGNEISLAQVQTMLGVADPRAIQKFILAIAHLDASAGLHLIHELTEAGADLRQINSQVTEYWRAMMISKAGANIGEILDNTEEETREIVQTAQLFELNALIECARVFAQNDLVQKNQGTPQLGLELALLACVELQRSAQAGPSLALPTPQTRPSSNQEAARPANTSPATRPQTPVRKEATSARAETPPVSTAVQPTPTVSESTSGELPDWGAIPYMDDDAEFASAPIYRDEPSVSVDPVAPAAPADAVADSQAAPTLTVREVKDKWEHIKRRIRTKKDGAKIAALLNRYTIISVEGSVALPVVLIQASAGYHYDTINQKSEYQESIEWGMEVELKQKCRVKLLPPGHHGRSMEIPPPANAPTLANTTAAVAPQQSAYRERPDPAPERSAAPPPPQQSQERPLPRQPKPDAPGSSLANTTGTSTNSSVPLARTGTVRENTVVPSRQKELQPGGETRLEMARKKATADPVVQKIVELFKAEIKDIRLK